RSLTKYSVPQEAQIKLNQNESPYDLPAELKREILSNLESWDWNRYPPDEQDVLQRRLAEYTHFTPEGLLPGCGSNELIQVLVEGLCSPGERIAVVTPGFSVYARIAAVRELIVNKIPLREDFSFDVERIAAQAATDRVVFLASPNNPTGTSLSPGDVQRLAESLSGILVIDEAYFEFSQQTAQDLLLCFDRLFILRTFSKAWGLAGLRLGYLIGDPANIAQLRKVKLPFSMGIFPLLAGTALLKRPQLVQEAVQTIKSERERVFRALSLLSGIDPIPSSANFILFRTRILDGEQLFQALLDRGILLRRFESLRLADHLRVTIGKSHENDAFLDVLKSVLMEAGQ
ncbi:histidinol-phosphate transaminase, partial [Acidobacteriota bacterium]